MKAKKSLGQNFLKSGVALRQIIEAGEIKPDDVILEIGPGKGALTEKLLEKAGLVIAVEKDYELISFLKEKFTAQIKSGALLLIQGDILEFDIKKTWQNILEKGGADFSMRGVSQADGPRGSAPRARGDSDPAEKESASKNYKIIANIPYNITGAILKKFLTEKHQPERMVLMVQHEVATRILARDGKESILSISVKAYGEPKMIAKVDKRYFSPAPKVNSAIISIKNISRKVFTSPRPSPYKGEGGDKTVQDKTLDNQVFEGRFWEIVKAGFAHKRKKLSGNLKGICQRAPLTPYEDKRAEDLKLEDWIVLAKL